MRVIKIVPQAGDMAQFVLPIQRTCVWFPAPITWLTPAWNTVQEDPMPSPDLTVT